MVNVTDTSICCYATKANGRGIRPFGSWKPGTSSCYIQPIKKDIYVIVDTELTGNTDKYCTYLRSLPNTSTGHRPTLMIIRPIAKKKYNQDEIDYLINEFSNPNHKTAAELNILKEKKASSSANYIKRDKTERLVWCGFTTKEARYTDIVHRKFNKNCWNNQTMDVAEGGFYVPIDRWSVQSKNPLYFDDVIINAIKLGILNSTTKIYGFSAVELKSALKYNNWVNVLDYCEEQFHLLNQNGVLTSRKVVDNITGDIGSNFANVIFANWDDIGDKLVDGYLKTFLTKLMDMKDGSQQYDTNAIEKFMTSLKIPSTGSHQLLSDMRAEWDAVTNRYPMLNMCTLYNVRHEQVINIVNYTNTVEKLLTIEEESSKI
jgi:hypothetical protein